MYYSNMYYLVPMTKDELESYKHSQGGSTSESEELRGKVENKEKLYAPLEGFAKGNMSREEYRGYKNYQPGVAKPKDEKEAMLYELMMYCFATHDISLMLDLKPTDKELYAHFNEYRNKSEVLLKNFEEKYGPLCAENSGMKNGTYDYDEVLSPWLR